MSHQLTDKFLGRSGGELPIELQNEKMSDPEVPDQRYFVLRCRQQMGASLGRKTVAGCRSNVTTTGVPPAPLAWRADVDKRRHGPPAC